MTIIWSPLALKRMQEYVFHIARDNQPAALKWANALFDKMEALKNFPNRGRNIPGVDRPDIREAWHGAYRVIYRTPTRHGPLIVLTVRHGKQLLDSSELA